MTFFALAGAISFCVFIAMYLNDTLPSNMEKRKWALFVFVGVLGSLTRSVPGLSTFVTISLAGLVLAALLSFAYKNIFKGIMSALLLMALIFGVEGLTLLLSRLFGFGADSFWIIPLYIIIIFVVFLLAFILKKFLEKRWANAFNHKVVRFLLISAGLALVLTLKNFAIEGIHITLGRWTVDFGDIAFLLFFASGAAMLVIILRYVSMETALRAEMLLTEASKKYVQDLEESYKTLRTIKHDYVNILTSFKLYIDSEDMAGLSKYYYNELSEMNRELLRQDQLMGSLQDVRLREIKSILIYKCSTAIKHAITTDIEVKDEIDSLGVSSAIVCQILGILLDNAIEAALEVDHKKLHIAIIKNPTSKVFVIKNTWEKQAISITKLYELGFTTKAEGKGLGLYTVRKYTGKIKGLYLETEVEDEYFIQTLTVKDG